MTGQEQQGPDFGKASSYAKASSSAKASEDKAAGQAPDSDVRGQASGGTPDNNPPQRRRVNVRGQVTPEVLKSAMKAFKKRLKLTALDDDSNLGRGPFSGGAKGIFAIQPPSQFPREVWEELCRQGKLRDSGHGMYELAK